MTPNLGQGANLAIEDAAELANALHAMVTSHRTRNPSTQTKVSKPSTSSVTTALTSFERKHLSRAMHIVNMSARLSRLHARQGLFYTILGRYIPPLFPSLPAELISAAVYGAPVLEFLPVPPREATGWVLLDRLRGIVLVVLGVFACLVSGLAVLRVVR
jgi:FAD dependent monooxygenase